MVVRFTRTCNDACISGTCIISRALASYIAGHKFYYSTKDKQTDLGSGSACSHYAGNSTL